ncbi:MAG: hypothetical protein ACKO13_16695 [Cytophagales bacterium]
MDTFAQMSNDRFRIKKRSDLRGEETDDVGKRLVRIDVGAHSARRGFFTIWATSLFEICPSVTSHSTVESCREPSSAGAMEVASMLMQAINPYNILRNGFTQH